MTGSMLRRAVRCVGIAAVLAVALSCLAPALGAQPGYPIVKQPLELVLWTPLNPNVAATCKSYGDILAFQEMEKRTGIKIKWLNPATGLDVEPFNLMLASRDLPDIMTLASNQDWFTAPGGAERFYQDKVIIPLNDLIDKHAPYLSKLLKENPEARMQLATDDGKIYFVPQMRIDPRLRVYMGFQVRKDWLDKLGLAVPTTVDEWYEVLKAFKTRDPNGNGKADEIPLTASRLRILNEFTRMAWPWGVCFGSFYNNGFMQVNGAVKFSPMLPEFKEALKFMNKLYAEGLLDPDFAIQERKQMDAKVLADVAGAYYGTAGSNLGKFMDSMAGKEPKAFKLVGAPFPKGPLGKAFNFENPVIQLVTGYGLAITTANKHPVETMKWLDYPFTPEGHMLFNFGVEGVTYKMENGYPRYTALVMDNPDKLPAAQAFCKYFLAAQNWAMSQDVRYFEQYQSKLSQDAIALWTQGTPERTLPPVTLKPPEAQVVSAKMSEINTYVEEMYLKFIMGVVPLDDFDKYVKQLKQMGIEEIVKIYQAAYDRYVKR